MSSLSPFSIPVDPATDAPDATAPDATDAAGTVPEQTGGSALSPASIQSGGKKRRSGKKSKSLKKKSKSQKKRKSARR
jgi:hypothetical protein